MGNQKTVMLFYFGIHRFIMCFGMGTGMCLPQNYLFLVIVIVVCLQCHLFFLLICWLLEVELIFVLCRREYLGVFAKIKS